MKQAEMQRKLVSGNTPIKPATLKTLEDLMWVRETPAASFYGNTGTGTVAANGTRPGWFVGFIESGERGFAFAASLQGPEASGANTRHLAETILLDPNQLNRQNPTMAP
jgi:beta-lactamase class D